MIMLSRTGQGATLDAGLEVRRATAVAERELQTVEGYCDFVMHTPRSDYTQREEARAMLKFFRDYRAAGETVKGFLWAPRADLCMLRLLCEQGRASPLLGQVGERMAYARVVDREERDFLVRLFAWAPAGRVDARRRTRSA